MNSVSVKAPSLLSLWENDVLENRIFFFPLKKIVDILPMVSESSAKALVSNVACRVLFLAQSILSAVALPFRTLATLFHAYFSDGKTFMNSLTSTVSHAYMIPLGLLSMVMPQKMMRIFSAISLNNLSLFQNPDLQKEKTFMDEMKTFIEEIITFPIKETAKAQQPIPNEDSDEDLGFGLFD